jgi:hypothetical protein
MQRHNANPLISMVTSPIDNRLNKLQTTLQSVYWVGKEGVFEFQFLTDQQPLMNTHHPLRFNLIRYQPNVTYDAFMLSIPGGIGNDESIQYGGGRTGKLNNKEIHWDNGEVWSQVMNVGKAKTDPLDLNFLKFNAINDSKIMGKIQNNYYFNDPYKGIR